MIPFIPEKWVDHLWLTSVSRCGLWPSYLSVFKEMGGHDDDLIFVIPHHLVLAILDVIIVWTSL